MEHIFFYLWFKYVKIKELLLFFEIILKAKIEFELCFKTFKEIIFIIKL